MSVRELGNPLGNPLANPRGPVARSEPTAAAQTRLYYTASQKHSQSASISQLNFPPIPMVFGDNTIIYLGGSSALRWILNDGLTTIASSGGISFTPTPPRALGVYDAFNIVHSENQRISQGGLICTLSGNTIGVTSILPLSGTTTVGGTSYAQLQITQVLDDGEFYLVVGREYSGSYCPIVFKVRKSDLGVSISVRYSDSNYADTNIYKDKDFGYVLIYSNTSGAVYVRTLNENLDTLSTRTMGASSGSGIFSYYDVDSKTAATMVAVSDGTLVVDYVKITNPLSLPSLSRYTDSSNNVSTGGTHHFYARGFGPRIGGSDWYNLSTLRTPDGRGMLFTMPVGVMGPQSLFPNNSGIPCKKISFVITGSFAFLSRIEYRFVPFFAGNASETAAVSSIEIPKNRACVVRRGSSSIELEVLALSETVQGCVI